MTAGWGISVGFPRPGIPKLERRLLLIANGVTIGVGLGGGGVGVGTAGGVAMTGGVGVSISGTVCRAASITLCISERELSSSFT